MTLSPKMRAVIRLTERGARENRAAPEPPLADRRVRMDTRAAILAPLPADVERTEPDVGVPCELLTPPGAHPSRVVMFLHGGGYENGSPRSHRELASRIARAAGAAALVPDYRLAPEHRHPAAVDDALVAYRWLLDRYPAGSVTIAGDSAGGGLTLATLVAARDLGLPMPAAAAALSPWTDLTCSSPSFRALADQDPVLTPEKVADLSTRFATDPRDPLASPLFADLTGLPPLLIEVGSREILLDDSVRFADAARAAGVDVTLEIGDGLLHVWHMAWCAREAVEATDRIGAFLARHSG